MKKIAFSRQDGGVTVLTPMEGARLVYRITLDGGEILPADASEEKSFPVDSILRGWPIAGAVANWAETEEEFVQRIAAKDAPRGAVILDETDLPSDRTARDFWRLVNGQIVVDPSAKIAAIKAQLQAAEDLAKSLRDQLA